MTRYWLGKKFSQEHKDKLKASWDYKKHITPQWLKKQKEIHKGIPVVPKGFKWSNEFRKYMLKKRKNMYTDEWKKRNSDGHLGSKAYQWKGGRIIQRGYIKILIGINKYKFEHRIVMEKYLGRLLTKNEQIHHIDRNKKNNKIENLMLFSNARLHTLHHKHLTKLKKSD